MNLPTHLRTLDTLQRHFRKAVRAIAFHVRTEVIVDAEEVDRCANDLHIAIEHERFGARP